jgi:hypothetical protein
MDDQQPPAADRPAPGSQTSPAQDPPAPDAREAELGLEAQARAHRLRSSV